MAIFDWEWGPNSVPRDGQKSPVMATLSATGLNSDCKEKR